ncbi:MAG: hypothetical protein LBB43_07170 [Spirochaetaceae bacterium]|nr:hypothetical protein [Spirochaetaceae bacterium]
MEPIFPYFLIGITYFSITFPIAKYTILYILSSIQKVNRGFLIFRNRILMI